MSLSRCSRSSSLLLLRSMSSSNSLSKLRTQDELMKSVCLNSNSGTLHPSCIDLNTSGDQEHDSLNANAGCLFPVHDDISTLSTGDLRHLLGSFSLTASGKGRSEQPAPELAHCTMAKHSSPLHELAGLRVSSASYHSFTADAAAAAAASSTASDTGKSLKLPDCRPPNTQSTISNKTALAMARHLHSQTQLQQLDELRKQFGSHQQQQQQTVQQPQESNDGFLTKMSESWQRIYNMFNQSKHAQVRIDSSCTVTPRM